MEGLPLAAFRNAAKEADMGIRDFSAPGGECWKDVNARAKDFIHCDILFKYFGQPIPKEILQRKEEQKDS